MIAVWLYLASYLLGAVPFGVLVARAKGVDIMSVGSGNIGATNVARTLGKGPGFLVLALDLVKGLLPALAARWWIGDHAGLRGEEQALVCGVLAVLGHSFSPFLRFRGGKGVATGLGMLLGAVPWVAAGALAVFVLTMLLTRIVSLSSILASGSLAVFALVFGSRPGVALLMTALFVYVLVRHRANIQRLREGKEPKFAFAAKPKAEPEPPS